jgi:hypothetical protein
MQLLGLGGDRKEEMTGNYVKKQVYGEITLEKSLLRMLNQSYLIKRHIT